MDGLGTAYLFFYDKQGHWGLGQDAVHAVRTHMEEAFSEWISRSAHFTISLFPLMEVWQQSVAASNHRRLRGWVENPVHNIPVVATGGSDSLSQLVGSAPQQAGTASGVEEVAEARLTSHTEAAQWCGRPPKSQCTTVGGGGSPPSSPDRGALDSNVYSTASETMGHQRRHRDYRGSREKKQFVPVRLDMPIFKLTDPGAEVTYTLWRFNVDAFLEQYDEASMRPHIFASLCGYPSKWAHTLDEGKDISMWDLLMHMEKTFNNKCYYDAMIRTLYEVQQREEETVEEYMLRIHDVVAVICHTYPERLPDWGWDLKKDRFYHRLHPYLRDALSFAMVDLPEREQACPTFDTLYTLAKKLEVGQPARTCQYTSSSEIYREKHRCYPVLAGRVATLEEEGLALTDPVTGEDSKSKVEEVDGLNVCLAQAMSHYQREE